MGSFEIRCGKFFCSWEYLIDDILIERDIVIDVGAIDFAEEELDISFVGGNNWLWVFNTFSVILIFKLHNCIFKGILSTRIIYNLNNMLFFYYY